MNELPSKQAVNFLREQFPQGCRVELVYMNDPYTKLVPGERGTVTCVDDVGSIHVQWDCGSTLGVAFGEDACRKIED